MHIFSQYDVVIFDCDGVILDSNNMKICAMRQVLEQSNCFSHQQIDKCISYFANNFGKGRDHHINYLANHADKSTYTREELSGILLSRYTEEVERGYINADETPGLKQLTLKLLRAKKTLYVASGSEETQLNRIFKLRKLEQYFAAILGSPTSKSFHLKSIAKKHPNCSIVMVGDATADYTAAQENGIDFVGVTDFSNTREALYHLKEKDERVCLISNFESP